MPSVHFRLGLLDELERLADDEFGGQVTRPYQTLLVIARKR
jgi:hypothetical protein